MPKETSFALFTTCKEEDDLIINEIYTRHGQKSQSAGLCDMDCPYNFLVFVKYEMH